jgi:hypothetical protein
MLTFGRRGKKNKAFARENATRCDAAGPPHLGSIWRNKADSTPASRQISGSGVIVR